MYSPLIKYRDIFGAPGTGVHQFKILNTAMVDYILTIVLAFVVSYYFKIPLVISTILMFALGIVAHALFGVKTDAVKFVF